MNRYPVGRKHMPRGWLRLHKRNFLKPRPSARRLICTYLIDLTDVKAATGTYLVPGLDDAGWTGVALCSGHN